MTPAEIQSALAVAKTVWPRSTYGDTKIELAKAVEAMTTHIQAQSEQLQQAQAMSRNTSAKAATLRHYLKSLVDALHEFGPDPKAISELVGRMEWAIEYSACPITTAYAERVARMEEALALIADDMVNDPQEIARFALPEWQEILKRVTPAEGDG